jgi:3-oxoacid CoA-transferase subunit B
MAADDPKRRIAERAACELQNGEFVNLGIGLPTLIPDYLAEDSGVFLHSENGIIGVGPRPAEGQLDPDLIDAGKRPVTELPGVAFFDSADSFAMIRGGHVHVAVLGALQVSAGGDVANWAIPGRDVMGVGGAMDLVVGARRVIITMTHVASNGDPKIVPACIYPLTARGCADVVVTDLAVFRLLEGRLTLTELMPGVSLDEVLQKTSADVPVAL